MASSVLERRFNSRISLRHQQGMVHTLEIPAVLKFQRASMDIRNALGWEKWGCTLSGTHQAFFETLDTSPACFSFTYLKGDKIEFVDGRVKPIVLQNVKIVAREGFSLFQGDLDGEPHALLVTSDGKHQFDKLVDKENNVI